jgi:hypothetical protein
LNTSGYDIDGLDKLPDKGPALLIYYHGTIPIDFYYIIARCLLEKDRHIRAVGDNFLFCISTSLSTGCSSVSVLHYLQAVLCIKILTFS